MLLVAATELELCGREGLVCGIGPVEAAAATARELALRRPAAVVHVGIAGGRGLGSCSMVLGTEAVYVDLSARVTMVFRVAPDADLLSVARGALPTAQLRPIGTTAAVGSTPTELEVEAMEGFGVLRACELAGVPAVELRTISNAIGEDDRSQWDVEGALRALAAAIDQLLPALDASLAPP